MVGVNHARVRISWVKSGADYRTAGAVTAAGAGVGALAAAPLPASSRTQEVNVAAAASIAIQRDLTNFNMWGVLFVFTYPPETPTFESPKVISSGVSAGPGYPKLITFPAPLRFRPANPVPGPWSEVRPPTRKPKETARPGDLAVNAPVGGKMAHVAVT